ncbi:MAG: hypothetical protein ABWZ25_13900 [Chitinophagaceae bacterium]
MRKITLVALSTFLLLTANAQDEKTGFEKERLFTGGSLTLSFFNGQTLLGANPVLGYTLTDRVDAGVAFNFLYNGSRDYYQYDDKVRQTVYGPGVFTRLYPVKFLFVQGQFEHNFTTLKYIPAPGSSYQQERQTTGTNSLLLGAGLAQGREPGSNTFFYISLLFDVLKNVNSPYVNVSYNPDNPNDQRVDLAPIIRAGVNIGLFQGRNKR